MKKIWDKRHMHWYSKKELGKLYWNKRHPDYLRDRLNEKNMKRLNKSNLSHTSNCELFLEERSNSLVIFKGLLIFWKWKLTVNSPSGMGKHYVGWRFIVTQRWGEVRRMILGCPKKRPVPRGLERLRSSFRRTLREINS